MLFARGDEQGYAPSIPFLNELSTVGAEGVIHDLDHRVNIGAEEKFDRAEMIRTIRINSHCI